MQIVCPILNLFIILLFVRVILSWFPISDHSPIAPIVSFLHTITEPVLGPLRRVLPPVALGGMGLDLSPIIVFFVVEFLVLPALCR